VSNGDSPANPINSAMGLKYEGLTKREYFAGLAMQGLISYYGSENNTAPEACAKRTLEMTDALLKELEK